MSLSEKPSDRLFPFSAPAPSEQALLAAITVFFIVLHLFAMTMLAPARQRSTAEPTEPAGLPSGD